MKKRVSPAFIKSMESAFPNSAERLDKLGTYGFGERVKKLRAQGYSDDDIWGSFRGLAVSSPRPPEQAAEQAAQSVQDVERGGRMGKDIFKSLAVAGAGAAGAGLLPRAIGAVYPAAKAVIDASPLLGELVAALGGTVGSTVGETAAYGTQALTLRNIALNAAGQILPVGLGATRFAAAPMTRGIGEGAIQAGATVAGGGGPIEAILAGLSGIAGGAQAGTRAWMGQQLPETTAATVRAAGMDPTAPLIRTSLSEDPSLRSASVEARQWAGGQAAGREQMRSATEGLMTKMGGEGTVPGRIPEADALRTITGQLENRRSALSRNVEEAITRAFPNADPSQIDAALMATRQAMEGMEAKQAAKFAAELTSGVGSLPPEQAARRLQEMLGKSFRATNKRVGDDFGKAVAAVSVEPVPTETLATLVKLDDTQRTFLTQALSDPNLPMGAPRIRRVVERILGQVTDPDAPPPTYRDFVDAAQGMSEIARTSVGDSRRRAQAAASIMRDSLRAVAIEGGMDPTVYERWRNFSDARRTLEPLLQARDMGAAFPKASRVAVPGSAAEKAMDVMQAEQTLTPEGRIQAVGTARAGVLGGKPATRAAIGRLEREPTMRGAEDVITRARLEAATPEAQALAGGTENLGAGMFPDSPAAAGEMARRPGMVRAETLLQVADQLSPQQRQTVLAYAFQQMMAESGGDPAKMAARLAGNARLTQVPEVRDLIAAFSGQAVEAKGLASALEAMKSQPDAVRWLLNEHVQTPENARRLMASLDAEGQAKVRDIVVGNVLRPAPGRAYQGINVENIDLNLPEETLIALLGPERTQALFAAREIQSRMVGAQPETAGQANVVQRVRPGQSLGSTVTSAVGMGSSNPVSAGLGALLSASKIYPAWLLDPQRSMLADMIQGGLRQLPTETRK